MQIIHFLRTVIQELVKRLEYTQRWQTIGFYLF